MVKSLLDEIILQSSVVVSCDEPPLRPMDQLTYFDSGQSVTVFYGVLKSTFVKQQFRPCPVSKCSSILSMSGCRIRYLLEHLKTCHKGDPDYKPRKND